MAKYEKPSNESRRKPLMNMGSIYWCSCSFYETKSQNLVK